MDITYAPRNQWRGRGRPPKMAPRPVVDMLRATLDGSMAVITIGVGEEELLREARSNLRAAARELGLRLHVQITGRELRFYGEEKSDGQ